MKKIKTIQKLASVLFTSAAAVITFGCQAQAPQSATASPPPSAQKQQANLPPSTNQCPSNALNAPEGAVKRAVTPKGQVIYIFAVWDAEAVPADQKTKCCASTQCWQTKDGKTWCAKPLAICPIKGNKCSGKGHMQTKDKKTVCPDNNCGKAIDGTPKYWAVKLVKNCKGKNKNCKANEHVKMKDGSYGCAPQADAKAKKSSAQTGAFPVLADEVVEDDTFLVTAN